MAAAAAWSLALAVAGKALLLAPRTALAAAAEQAAPSCFQRDVAYVDQAGTADVLPNEGYTSNAQDCQRSCQARGPFCTSFSWLEAGDASRSISPGGCWAFDSNATSEARPGFISGPKYCPEVTNATGATGATDADSTVMPVWGWIVLVICAAALLGGMLHLCGCCAAKKKKKQVKKKKKQPSNKTEIDEDGVVESAIVPLASVPEATALLESAAPQQVAYVASPAARSAPSPTATQGSASMASQASVASPSAAPAASPTAAVPAPAEAVPMARQASVASLSAAPSASPTAAALAAPAPPAAEPVATLAAAPAAPSAAGRMSLFDVIDRNHDGGISFSEFSQAMGRQQPVAQPAPQPAAQPPAPPAAGRMSLFDVIDRNHDGGISLSEFTQAMGRQPPAALPAPRPAAQLAPQRFVEPIAQPVQTLAPAGPAYAPQPQAAPQMQPQMQLEPQARALVAMPGPGQPAVQYARR